MRIKDGFVVREIGGKYFAVPVGERSRDFHAMISLNDTAKKMWELLLKETTPDEVSEALASEYGISADKVRNDVLGFIDTLRKADLILE